MTLGEMPPGSEVVIGGIYTHFQGTKYVVDELIPASDGYEVTGELNYDVLHTQLTDGDMPAGTQYTRSEDEFLHGTVEVDGEEVPIFTFASSAEIPQMPPRKVFSSLMFGRSSRIDVWSVVLRFAVEPPEPFRLLEVQTELEGSADIPRGNTAVEIEHLRDDGMIRKVVTLDELPPDANRRAVYYVRVKSPVWNIAETAVRITEEPSGAE